MMAPGHAVTPCSSGGEDTRHETARPLSQPFSERKPRKKESFTGIVVMATYQVEYCLRATNGNGWRIRCRHELENRALCLCTIITFTLLTNRVGDLWNGSVLWE